MSRLLRAAVLAVAGGAAGAGVAATVSFAIPRDRAPAARLLVAPVARRVDHGARLRLSDLRFVPAHGEGPATLDFDVRNGGTSAATGIGYVLQDGSLPVAYQETNVLGPGEGEHQRLEWSPAGPGARRLTLTVGDGNVKWVVYPFDVPSTLIEGAQRAWSTPALAGGASAGSALGALVALAGARREA